MIARQLETLMEITKILLEEKKKESIASTWKRLKGWNLWYVHRVLLGFCSVKERDYGSQWG